MITESMIKDEFIHQTISAGMQKINKLQQEVVNAHFKSTGNLSQYLANRPFGVSGRQFYMRQLSYMRFLDIGTRTRLETKRLKRDLSLYNRVVWGVMYGEVMPELRYGLTDAIKESITKALENAGNEKE